MPSGIQGLLFPVYAAFQDVEEHDIRAFGVIGLGVGQPVGVFIVRDDHAALLVIHIRLDGLYEPPGEGVHRDIVRGVFRVADEAFVFRL